MSCKCDHKRATYCDVGQGLLTTLKGAFDDKMAYARLNMDDSPDLQAAWHDAKTRFHDHLDGAQAVGGAGQNPEREQAPPETQTEELMIPPPSSGGSNIPPHPAGQFAVRCIDLIDLGLVERSYKGEKKVQHRIVLRFIAGETFEDEDGETQPLWVEDFFTWTCSEKGNLRKFLNSWRGRPFAEREMEEFNVAKLVGVPALIQVSHNIKPEKTYANIDSVMRLPNGMDVPAAPTGYVRVKDRPPREEETNDVTQAANDKMPF